MTGTRCADSACLYSSASAAMPSSFAMVTTATREGVGLWESCKHCGLVVNRSGVDPAQVDDFYNAEYVAKNSYSAGELLSARQHFEQRLETIRPVADALTPYLSSTARVFELGAATGELLYLLRDRVRYCHGNEINQLYANFIRTDLGIDASHDDYLALDVGEKFDVVISINTVDHMEHTRGVLEKLYGDLTPGGVLYLEVPNDAQALNRYLPEASQAAFSEFMYQKAHYYSFTFATLSELLGQIGFRVEREISRHDYTLKNFLQWYFLGQPQKELRAAMLGSDLFRGNSTFERDMNAMFEEFDRQFRVAMSENKVGEIACIIARKPETSES